MVGSPLTIAYRDLLALPAQEDIRVIESANNPVGGELVANLRLRGAQLAELLGRVNISPEATHARLEAADGYTAGVALAQIAHPATLLVYAIDGAPLTPAHGGPARIHIPGLYGYKMPRWLTRIRFTNAPYRGYWESRGWSDSGEVRTHAIIHTPATNACNVRVGQPIAIQGVALAGLRRIARVEVQIDGGEWMPARLAPGGSPLAWTQWHLVWTFAAPGVYQIGARATDDTGFAQSREGGEPFPDGADGIHRVTIRAG